MPGAPPGHVPYNHFLYPLLALQLDLAFSQAPGLARLPRVVYALLRSPLLAPPAPGQHPDLSAFLRHLWAVLPPGELVRAVYPVLTSYSDADTPVSLQLGLLLSCLV